MDIFNEEEYLEKFPVINDIVESTLTDYGIDKEKYRFSECSTWKHDKDITYYCVYYGSTFNDDVTLGVTIGIELNRIKLEELCLSLD